MYNTVAAKRYTFQLYLQNTTVNQGNSSGIELKWQREESNVIPGICLWPLAENFWSFNFMDQSDCKYAKKTIEEDKPVKISLNTSSFQVIIMSPIDNIGEGFLAQLHVKWSISW